MPLNSDNLQAVKKALGSFNFGVNAGLIAAADISGANTYAVFRANVASYPATATGEQVQALNTMILPGLDLGNRLGILTDTNLNSKTTTAQVQALFTAEDPTLAAGYTGDSIQ